MFHFFVPKLTPNFFGAAEKKFDYPMTSLFKEKKSLEILEEKEMKIFSSRNWDKNALKWKLGSWIIFLFILDCHSPVLDGLDLHFQPSVLSCTDYPQQNQQFFSSKFFLGNAGNQTQNSWVWKKEF